MERVKILALTFNTQSVRICESLDSDVVNYNRSGFTTWKYNCTIADFFPVLIGRILTEDPTIVIISFQEDVHPGSYAHSHLLIEEMGKIQYSIFGREKLLGVGKTSITGLTQADPFVRGLRISVYVKSTHTFFNKHPADTYSNSIFQNKGAIGIYITLGNGETLAIINCHLPFDAKSLIESVDKKDDMIRRDALTQQNVFFNKAYRKLILESPAKPVYVLVMGDLNYRIIPFLSWSAKETTNYILSNGYADVRDYDELYMEMAKGNIYPFDEGVNNVGPTFSPTCKMIHDRKDDQYSLGKHDQRVASYCDRILYNNLQCLSYENFEHGMINKSDHAAVLGIFII